jgi:ABC-type branched-subunit amino acid transport system substrate-binding protein
MYALNIFSCIKCVVALLVAISWCSRDAAGVKIPENHTLKIAIVTPFINKNTQKVPHWSAAGMIASILAIEAINNKTDNIFDDLLPNTTIVYEMFDSKQDPVTTAILAPKLLQAFNGEGADIVLGSGTSGVSIALHSILKHFDIPQVSPSATSGYLSVTKDCK